MVVAAERKTDVEEYKKKKDEFERAIRQVEKHVQKKGGRLTLEAKDAKAVDVDPVLFDDLKRALDNTNEQVKSGKLKLDEVLLKTPDLTSRGDRPSGVDVAAVNHSGIQYFWWGYRVFLDHTETDGIAAILQQGAAAGAVLAFLTSAIGGAIPAGVVAGILSLASGVLMSICGAGGHEGIYFNFAWPAIWWGVWHQ
jgi:hypothetical protein